MEQLVKMIVTKTGISEKQATMAVEMVLGFLKEKLPPQIASQIDMVAADKKGGIDISDAANMVGGLLKKK